MLLVIELVLLYFLSRWVTKSLFHLFILIFRSRTVAITILLVLTFPGTVIHELAHLFTAEILRVPTGKLTLVPESIRAPSANSGQESIRSGSVAVAETDPFRRYAIGLAPIFWGILTLTAISFFLPTLASQGESLQGWWKPIEFYLLFAISNTMFSSPEDLKGFIPFAIVIAAFAATAYLWGLRVELTGEMLGLTGRILTTLTGSLGVVLLVNVILFIASRLIISVYTTLFRAKSYRI